LKDLSKYQPQAVDGAVIAWPEHTPPDREKGKRDIHFTVAAKKVIETEDGRAIRIAWAKAQEMIERQQKKIGREERAAKRKEVQKSIEKDEL